MEEDNVRDVLQTTLTSCESLSPKIAGLIRRFKAVSTLLLMRKDSAFADLDKYTKSLRSWVDDFDDQIQSAIHLAYTEKAAVIKAYKEELEEEMSTLSVLLQESRKLLQMSRKFDATQNKHGKTLVTALKMMKAASCLETRDVDENLACLRLSTQLDWKNLPKLGQLVTCDLSDENELEVKTLGDKSCKCSKEIAKPSVKSESTQTDIVQSEKETVSESKASKSKNSYGSQKSKDNRSFTNQKNQRFIISQLEKGGISKQGTRSLTVSSTGGSVNNNHREEGPRRRPVIRDSKFKLDTSQPRKRSVIKKEDNLGDIVQNYSKGEVCDNPKSSLNVPTTENSQKTENCIDNSLVKTRMDGLRKPRPISLSPRTPEICKTEENRGTGTDCNALTMVNGETNADTAIVKQLFDPDVLKRDKTEKPDVDEEVESCEVSASVKDSSQMSHNGEDKQHDTGSKSSPTENGKNSSSPSTPNACLPTDITIKSEPITPVDSIAPVVVEIKQELMTPPDFNSNNQVAVNQNKPNPVLKCSSSVSKAEGWESDEEIKGRLADKIQGVISDRFSAEKDVNCDVTDEPHSPPERPPQTARLTSGVPLHEPNSTEKSPPDNDAVPLLLPSLPADSSFLNSNSHSLDPDSTGKSQLNSNKVPHSGSGNKVNGGEEFHSNDVDSKLDCCVSDIPLPPTQDSPQGASPNSHSNDVDSKLDCCVSDIPLPSTQDSPKGASPNSYSNDVDSKLDCCVSDIPLPSTQDSPKGASPNSYSNDEENELDGNVLPVSQDIPKRISPQNVTIPCPQNNVDSAITQHVREEIRNGKKGNFSPVSAKLLFKVGTKDNHLKYPIGVTTNGNGEIFVADTGNHLVRMYNDQGKFLKSLGKEVHMKRPSAIVINNKDEMFVKDDFAIHAFTAGGKFVKTLAKSVLGHPFGLDLTPDGLLVTLDTQRSNPRVIIISQDGTRIRKFPFVPLLDPSTRASTKCRFLAIQAERLIVSDLGTSCVYISDNYGEILCEFGEYGTSLGKFREPSGVTTDQQGHILVGDSKNDRIQIFKPNGSFLCDIEFDKAIQRPSDIHLTKDGKLYVTNFLLHQVFVYQLGQK